MNPDQAIRRGMGVEIGKLRDERDKLLARLFKEREIVAAFQRQDRDLRDRIRDLEKCCNEQQAEISRLRETIMSGPGKTSRKAPGTSRDAARLSFGSERYRVLEALDGRGQHYSGFTAAELAERVGKSRNQTAARLLELREAGYAVRATDANGEYLRRPVGPNSTGIVHTITYAGHDRIKQLHEVHQQ